MNITSIHLGGTVPPDFILKHVISVFSKYCSTFTFGEEIPPDVEVLIGDVKILEKMELRHLKLVIVPYAGIRLPKSLVECIKGKFPRVPILNLHHNAIATAETGITLLLAAAKQTVPVDRDIRKGDWSSSFWSNNISHQQRTTGQMMLNKKKILILGYGRIGTLVAGFCNSLGMEVHGLRRSISTSYTDALGTVVHPLSALDSLLPQCRVLFSVLPGTVHTEGLVDAKRLNLLPDQAIVVNIGRGSVFVEKDLYEALQSGKLFAAGLDVWWSYPPRDDPEKMVCWPPSQYDFGSLENVVMSPHRGGGLHTREVEEQRYQDLGEIIQQVKDEGWENMKNHPNVVNVEFGY